MFFGRVFRTQVRATVNAQLPTVENMTGGTSRWLVSVEYNVRQLGRSATESHGDW